MAYRECTTRLLAAIQDGTVDRDAVITAALQHMSEDEVRDMCEGEGWFDVEDDEPEDGMDGDHDSAMASAGWGTDEDYGHFGGEEF